MGRLLDLSRLMLLVMVRMMSVVNVTFSAEWMGSGRVF